MRKLPSLSNMMMGTLTSQNSRMLEREGGESTVCQSASQPTADLGPFFFFFFSFYPFLPFVSFLFFSLPSSCKG